MNMSIPAPAALASSAGSSLPEMRKMSFMPGIPSRWFFPLEKVTDNPSVSAGIDLERELQYRQQSASFIHDLGTKLHLPPSIMNVAIVYMQRFYVFHSFKRFYKNDIASAALFLAAKVEEMPRKLEHIVKVSYALQHRDDPQLDTSSDKYMDEAQKIATYENIILQTLGFDLNVEVPNSFIVKRIQMLNVPKALAFAAYHFATDSLHLTTLCLRYRPAVIACACIFLACDWAKWEITTKQEGKPWYAHMDPEVTLEILKVLAEEVVNAFHRCPERLRNRRHMASIKRDSNGVVIPSSVMLDRHNDASLTEFHTAIPTRAASVSSPSVTSAAPAAPAVESSVKKSSDRAAAQDIGQLKFNPVLRPTVPSTSVSMPREMSNFEADSPMKPRLETSKVDLKSYKERVRDRKTDRPKIVSRNGCSEIPARKSFIPDMSSMLNDSWMLDGTGDEKSKEAGNTSAIPNDGYGQVSDDDRRRKKNANDNFRASAERKRSKWSPVANSSCSLEESGDASSIQQHSLGLETVTIPFAEAAQSFNDAIGQGSQFGAAGKRRSFDGPAFPNGVHPEKVRRIIDYAHGAKAAADLGQSSKIICDYDHGSSIVTDYGHASAAATGYANNKDGWCDDGGQVSDSACFSSSTTFSADDWLSNEAALKRDQSYVSFGSHAPLGRTDCARNGQRSNHTVDEATAADNAQTKKQSSGERERKSQIKKPDQISAGKSAASLDSIRTISSIVGGCMPHDDVLRQAARKAEQMQQMERLKNTKAKNHSTLPVNGQNHDLTKPSSATSLSQRTKDT